jgi:O-antigen ligase
MAACATTLSARRALLLAGLATLLWPLAVWIGRAPLHQPLFLTVAVVIFTASILQAEAGLGILIASMLLSPELALGSAGAGGVERAREVILRTEDLVLLIVGLAWLARMAIHKDLGAVRRTRLNGAIALYVACCLFSTLVGIESGRVRPLVGLCYVAKHIEYFFIFFLTVNYVRTKARLRRLLLAVLGTAAVITAYGWWQIPQGIRPSAPFEGHAEPNTLGGYLVLMLAVASGVALTADRPWMRRTCGALALTIVPPLLATLSRGSWLACVAAILTLLVLAPRRGRLVAAVIVAFALLVLATPQRIEERIQYTFTAEGSEAVALGRLHLDASSSARINSWHGALQGFLRHPVTGWGITGYGFLDAQYFRVLVELGAFGFAAFLLLIATCGWMFLRSYRTLSDPLHRGLALGLVAGLAGLLTHALAANTFLIVRIMEPFWLLTGLLVAADGLEAAA